MFFCLDLLLEQINVVFYFLFFFTLSTKCRLSPPHSLFSTLLQILFFSRVHDNGTHFTLYAPRQASRTVDFAFKLRYLSLKIVYSALCVYYLNFFDAQAILQMHFLLGVVGCTRLPAKRARLCGGF